MKHPFRDAAAVTGAGDDVPERRPIKFARLIVGGLQIDRSFYETGGLARFLFFKSFFCHYYYYFLFFYI